VREIDDADAFKRLRHAILLFSNGVVGRKSVAHSANSQLRHDRAMSEYRRNRLPGATYFFTVNLLSRRSDLLVANIEPLREAVRQVHSRRPFHIDAWVVLPNHMHALWTLPGGDSDFPGRWRAIKIAFSKSLPNVEQRSGVMSRRRERGIWQRRYWEHTIRDDCDYAAHMDYIHFNPVKHGLVAKPGTGHSPASVVPSPPVSIRRNGPMTPLSAKPVSGGNGRRNTLPPVGRKSAAHSAMVSPSESWRITLRSSTLRLAVRRLWPRAVPRANLGHDAFRTFS
jgi:putative transposase